MKRPGAAGDDRDAGQRGRRPKCTGRPDTSECPWRRKIMAHAAATKRGHGRPETIDNTDAGDLITDYAYLAGLIELIDDGNADDARKCHKAIPPGSICDADARVIHQGIGSVLKTESPSVQAIHAAVRESGGRASRRVVEIFARISNRTRNGKEVGSYILGLPHRVREIEERHAREEGFHLAEKLRVAVEDRSAGPETFAGLRRYLDHVESLILRRPVASDEVGFVTMDKVEAKPMAWLWPGRLMANGLNVVTGLMGQTKGFFMVDVAAKITNGSRWPDGTGHAPRGSVVWVGNEDDPATVLRPRLDAAGADVSKVHYVAGIRSGSDADDFRPLSIGQDLSKIAAALERLTDCRMIVLDPVTEFMEADENASKEIRAELMPLVRLAADRGIALVVVCHQNKKQGLSTLQKIAGGGAFGQIARAVLVFSEDPSEESKDDLRRKRLMVVAKMSGGKKNVGQSYRLNIPDGQAVPAIEWIPGELAIDADDIGFRPSGGRAHQDRTGDAVDMLRELLANGPRKAREVWSAMEAAGHGRRQRENAADKLSVVKQQSGREWVWSLPLETAAGEVGPDGIYRDFEAHALDEGEWTNPFRD